MKSQRLIQVLIGVIYTMKIYVPDLLVSFPLKKGYITKRLRVFFFFLRTKNDRNF